MVTCLRTLGIDIEADFPHRLSVTGCRGNIPAATAKLFVENSGTTMRFLTACVALGQGAYTLDGIQRMRQRPIGDLITSLRQLGVDASAADDDQFPPVEVRANGLPGGPARIAGSVSSQFLSGLLMAAPYAQQDVRLSVTGQLVSRPYVEMTCRVMNSFGIDVEIDADRFSVPRGAYTGRTYDIEPDASAATYFWAVAAVTGGEVSVLGLTRSSLQGDIAFCNCLQQMGCQVSYESDAITVKGAPLTGINVDMNHISDAVPTLAVVAMFAEGPTTISNVGHIRHKETDRISDLSAELRKVGATVEETEDGLTIMPGTRQPALIETYNDHRLAMSFAVAGLATPGIRISNPECTAKTYPEFFQDLAGLAGA
jgi:3-phosphoshikimate 1-carboxyvinyltransferase